MSKVTVDIIRQKKTANEPITALTAYDYPLASIIDKAGIDIILVGDSLANVVLGLKSTTSVGMAEMLHHTKAVRRAVAKSMLIGDMPYEAYQLDTDLAVKNARRFMDEAGCDAVKLEWFERCPEVTKGIVKAGIPVMGHIGLTPQTADKLGGFKVQGKDADAAKKLIEEALLLEDIGIFSIVLECVPDTLAAIVTEKLKIPTIGIGAGKSCDGQVLVTYDMLGLLKDFKPKFVKEYAGLYSQAKKAIEQYRDEVKNGIFPSREYSYSMDAEEAKKLQ